MSSLKVAVLRLFGARIGRGVKIKPAVQIKFPWRLKIGAYSWIGEQVWIDNLAEVSIGDNCCISQGAYFCTGNHDRFRETFDLLVQPIVLQSHVWVCAHAIVGPGVTIGEGAALSLGSVAVKNLKPWSIYSGNPATRVSDRRFQPEAENLPANLPSREANPA